MKILFAIDGSPQAQAALETLIGKLGFLRETPRLTLFHVHPPVPHTAAVTIVGKEAVEKYYRDESEGVLESAGAFLSARGIPFRGEWRVGDPAEEIVKLATDEQFDMIAMGTHGHTALVNLVMGSVATKVVALSKLPVLLLK